MTPEEYAEQDRGTRLLRTRRTIEALKAIDSNTIYIPCQGSDGLIGAQGLEAARSTVRALRASLQGRDVVDPQRYAACNTALTALGALWAVS